MPPKLRFRWFDFVTINIYYLGLTTLSQTMAPLVYPLLIQQFVGEQAKGTYYGMLRLWSLMVALLAQAFWGIISDRSSLAWGRRRPFIFGGTVIDLVFIGAIGFSAGLSGWTGFWFLFVGALFLQVSSNAAHAAQQAVIPDLVPEDQRGRFSAIKAVFEVPLPVILVSFTIGRLIGAGNMPGAILVSVAVLLLSMLIAMFIPERPWTESLPPLDWEPFGRLVLMTAIFTVVILGLGEGIKALGIVLDSISDLTTTLLVAGTLGVVAMTLAVGLGVWMSVNVSLGSEARDNASFTWWVINRLAYLVGAINVSTFAVFFLQGRLGLEREMAAGPAANLLLVVGILILIFALISGWVADRLGHKRTVAISGILAAIGVGIAITIPNLTVIYLGGAFIGMATGMFYTANWALGTDLVPTGQAGRYLGVSNLAGAGAGAVGAYIGGPLADYFTIRFPQVPGLGYVVLFAIFGVLFLLSVVALTRVKQPSDRRLDRRAKSNAWQA